MTEQRPHEFRGRIYNNVTETVGATPLIRLSRLAEDAGVGGHIIAKCEFYNPLGSVKDRIGLAMIEAAEKDGRITAGATLVEPTSGNTGIALAFVCAAKGYRLILTMPESMSIERRKMLLLLGAEIELTAAPLGMRGAIDKARELTDSTPGAIMLQQFDNPANPEIHRNTTAEEIWADSAGQADVLISGVGTGGTLTGCASVLKTYNPDFLVVAVEPEDSPILSGGTPGPHKIQGIGAGFVPGNLDTSLIDEVLKIGNETAFAMARKVARLEGIACGISSGAALAAALEIAARPEMAGKNIITILPSFAERYLSTALFDGLA
ncbi:MAG: cysteine synthase A [Rhodospirillales bacterium]|nr:cysteine synthase A [Rhodospirillales bacterium]